MDLSRRDAFRPCSRDSLGDKGQFCFISQKKKINWNRPPLPFLGYTFSSSKWLLQNLFIMYFLTIIGHYSVLISMTGFKFNDMQIKFAMLAVSRLGLWDFSDRWWILPAVNFEGFK